MKQPSHHRPSDEEAIEATAAAWLAQRDDGLSPVEEAEFARWRAADRRHEAAVGRLEATWNALQQLREFRPEARMHPDSGLLRSRGRPRRIARARTAAAIIALAASIVLAVAWWRSSGPSGRAAHEQHYATTADGFERVLLDDGSVVELNSASEVRVRFTPAARRVRLVRGEAHFTVTRDAARPFSVEADAITVQAVGTAFNVRLNARDVEVLVTHGKVAVADVARLATDAVAVAPEPDQTYPPPSASPPRMLLNANERLVIPAAPARTAAANVPPPAVEKLAPEVVREALAWQAPRLVFVDAPLADAIAQFNRRNQVQIVLADPELGALPIGGSFRAENVDAFVRLLASGNDIVLERPDPLRIVLRKAK